MDASATLPTLPSLFPARTSPFATSQNKVHATARGSTSRPPIFHSSSSPSPTPSFGKKTPPLAALSRSASPLFSVSNAFDGTRNFHFVAASTCHSPGIIITSFSPTLPAWKDADWNPGAFSWGQGSTPDGGNRDDHEGFARHRRSLDDERDSESDMDRHKGSSEVASTSDGSGGTRRSSAAMDGTAASSVDIDLDAESHQAGEASSSPSEMHSNLPESSSADCSGTPLVRSSLAPTATPFIFKPKAPSSTSSSSTRTSTTLVAPSSLSSRFSENRVSPPSSDSSFPSPPSPVGEPYTPPALHPDLFSEHNPGAWSFNNQGLLVDRHGQYDIADEILQLQGDHVLKSGRPGQQQQQQPLPPLRLFLRQGDPSNDVDETYGHPAQQHHHKAVSWNTYPAARSSQAPFPSPQVPSGPTGRSCISSLNNATSAFTNFYFTPRAVAERSPTAAQLQAYFGPSPVEVNPPLDYPPSFPLHSLSSSYSSGGSPSTTTEAEQQAEEALYLLARQSFVQQSLLSLNSSPSSSINSLSPQFIANQQAMIAHFDRAMASPNPLATLYGLSVAAAEALLLEPEKSGIGEAVLIIARMRMEKARRGEALGGPSANNCKLGLYKTELCRSWEEKGSCRYGSKCQFAHGAAEIREVARHPKFKSEVCRTFWLHGSCPYGRRCCFIHATVPGSGPGPAPDALAPPRDNPLAAVGLDGSSNHPDNASAPASRLAQRMSTTSSERGYGPFGPALATYLGPNSTSTMSSPAHGSNSSTFNSYSNSPTESLRDFGPNTSNGALFGVPFDQWEALHAVRGGLGISIKPPGRFTNNPTEVPATYQDPPQSRLQRIKESSQQQPQQQQLQYQHQRALSFDRYDSPYPSAPGSAPLSRHGSIGSASSHSTGPAYSPLLLNRVESNGSVSSLGTNNSPHHRSSETLPSHPLAPPMLKPAGDEWFRGAKPSSTGSLDWSAPAASLEDDHQAYNTASHQHQQHYDPTFDLSRRFGSLSIDRSSELTPLAHLHQHNHSRMQFQ